MTEPTGLDPAVEYHIVNSLGWPDLRPLQRAAVEPVRSGGDCLLLAPTAGGKTEAAFFPLLTQMLQDNWQGPSVLYVTPLRALLNNLEPRLAAYTGWVGRSVALWHGDTGQGERRRILADPPDVLLTTPESLEAMLVSTRVDHNYLFAHLRAVVVDELHAFAGDDRGWHLLAVLERLQVLAGRRIQRIGLSATVGNPEELLHWLGGGTPAISSQVVSPDSAPAGGADITVDYVATIDNAATVISRLHLGEKRLVFCESRAQAEDLASALRERDVLTFVSHSSLSRDERRRSEQAFAEARDCVVVATSTLELGIDVGDLDRVIQIDAPTTVASFLQRLGRTGRRPGTQRNMLFLAVRKEALLQACALLALWGDGFVEPVRAPVHPRHIIAQQLLALTLQEGAIGLETWQQWWPDWEPMWEAPQILDHLVAEGFLATDSGLGFVGDAAEQHFGRRHFMDLTAVFTADPELTVTVGRKEIGTVSPVALTQARRGEGPTILALAGRSWRVTQVDWRQHRVAVVEDDTRGRSRWSTPGGGRGLSREMAGAIREVLLGRDPGVRLSRRATAQLDLLRSSGADIVDADGIVLQRDEGRSVLWTFAGSRANLSLATALGSGGVTTRPSALNVTYEGFLAVSELRSCSQALASDQPPQPVPDQDMLDGLKFSAALPPALAADTLGERLSDPAAAAGVAGGRVVVG